MKSQKDKIIFLEDIKEELRLIDGSETDYITPTGKIYAYKSEFNGYILKNNHINNHNGYTYACINFKGEHKQRRVHVLVAKAYIPNPNNYRIVGHKHNNKSCTDVNELYWTTNQENVNRAINDGLLKNKTGIENQTSNPVKVIDKQGNVVGIYGSIRECDRCIENINASSIHKFLKKNGDYTPRSKKYKYIPITKEEYMSFPNELKGIHLIETNLKGSKQPKQFKAINLITGEIIISDNQKQFSKEYGLQQANVSHAVLNNSYHGDWKFQLIQKINVKDSSAYQNQINNLDGITIKNINTGEIKEFKTVQSMKDFLGILGHDIKQYILNDNILMDEWKII